MTGEAIAEEIIRVLGKSGLNIEHCRGQSYDGGSNMLDQETVRKRFTLIVVDIIPVMSLYLRVIFRLFEIHSTSLKKHQKCLC